MISFVIILLSSHLPTSLISLHLANSPHFANTLNTVAAKILKLLKQVQMVHCYVQESSEMDEFPKWEPFNQKYWNSASKIKILECRFRVKFTKKFGLNLWGYPLCWKLKNCGSICYWKFSEKKATSFVEWKALSENWDKSAVWTFLFFNWFKNMWITSALTLNHNPNPYH